MDQAQLIQQHQIATKHTNVFSSQLNYCRKKTWPDTCLQACLVHPPFDGSNFKRWRARAILWFTAMECFHVAQGKPAEPLSDEDERKFNAADNLFRGALVNILADNIVDVYMHLPTGIQGGAKKMELARYTIF